LQQEADKLKDQKQYIEAVKKYKEAQKRFQDGYEHDVRFKNCVEVVQKCLESIVEQQFCHNIAKLTFSVNTSYADITDHQALLPPLHENVVVIGDGIDC